LWDVKNKPFVHAKFTHANLLTIPQAAMKAMELFWQSHLELPSYTLGETLLMA
jgi:hypothetical protein